LYRHIEIALARELEASMKLLLMTFALGAITVFAAPLRRRRAAPAPTMDAATYTAMLAEAERIAAPYEQHLRSLRATTQAAGDFAEVEALLDRAGLLAS
jgi:hypothetical protein